MHYIFDLYGRFAGTSPEATERSTPTAPPAHSPDYNWTGADWVFAHVPDFVPVPVVPEPTAEDLRSAAKATRELAVSQIRVTTTAGNTFDGDETSQTRMARAIIALSTGLAPSVPWVLADNSVIDATAAELTEALVLSGQAQAALWVLE